MHFFSSQYKYNASALLIKTNVLDNSEVFMIVAKGKHCLTVCPQNITGGKHCLTVPAHDITKRKHCMTSAQHKITKGKHCITGVQHNKTERKHDIFQKKCFVWTQTTGEAFGAEREQL